MSNRLALIPLTGAGETHCNNCRNRVLDVCDIFGRLLSDHGKPYERFQLCVRSERDASRLRAVEVAASGVLENIEGALAEAENVADGRKGMQVPYFGLFAGMLHMPPAIRNLRELARALRAALKES